METDIVFSYGLKCCFVHCGTFGASNGFFRSLLKRLRDLDSVFYTMAPFPSTIDEEPESQLEPDGKIVGFIMMSHPLMEPVNPVWSFRGEFRGRLGAAGGLDNSFRISDFSCIREDSLDFELVNQDRAEGRVRFFKMLVPHVGPKLGFIDDVWGSVVKDKQVEAAELKKLFWVTYFGPNYLERHGKEFFLNAPAWSVEELDNGVLLRSTETFLEFSKREPKELIKYMRQKFKGMTVNRFNIHPAF